MDLLEGVMFFSYFRSVEDLILPNYCFSSFNIVYKWLHFIKYFVELHNSPIVRGG